MTSQIVLDELDTLAVDLFPGLVVRKDLLRRMRSSFGVPAFVIEFLLGKYCSSADEDVIREGETGFLASTTEEWVERLRALIDSAELRQRMGQLGRRRAEGDFSLEAAGREPRRSAPARHSGFHASTASISMNVAKASFSQIPFHHRIVTRSPNHMWATS